MTFMTDSKPDFPPPKSARKSEEKEQGKSRFSLEEKAMVDELWPDDDDVPMTSAAPAPAPAKVEPAVLPAAPEPAAKAPSPKPAPQGNTSNRYQSALQGLMDSDSEDD